MRQEIKKPIKSKTAVLRLMNKFEEFTIQESVDALNESIQNEYQGVFPKKRNGNGSGKFSVQRNEKSFNCWTDLPDENTTNPREKEILRRQKGEMKT